MPKNRSDAYLKNASPFHKDVSGNVYFKFLPFFNLLPAVLL